MTALLEFKQKIKGLYAKYEMYLQPLMKFVLALVYFIWINSNMGYMTCLLYTSQSPRDLSTYRMPSCA